MKNQLPPLSGRQLIGIPPIQFDHPAVINGYFLQISVLLTLSAWTTASCSERMAGGPGGPHALDRDDPRFFYGEFINVA
ncbi:MAG: hypothetical protein AB2535_07080 [Candidatus Thiodiazotropha endolucinida]